MQPSSSAPGTDEILLGDNLDLLPGFADETFQLIYIDPPFNTGKLQSRKTLQTVQAGSQGQTAPDEAGERTTDDGDGDRTGFKGRRYTTRLLEQSSYRDTFDDYLAFLAPRLQEAHRLLK